MTEKTPRSSSTDMSPVSLHICLGELLPRKFRMPVAVVAGGLALGVTVPQIPVVHELLPPSVRALYDVTGGSVYDSLVNTLRVIQTGDPFAPGKDRGVSPGLPVGPADIPILPFPAQSEVPLG